MREVLAARSHRDFVSAAPRRSRPLLATAARGLLAAALQRPGMLVGGLAISAAAAAIVINALSFQSARHPAPIFAKAERSATSGRATEPAAPTLPPVPPTRPQTVSTTAALPPPAPRVATREPTIADLLNRGADTTGSASPGARPADARVEPQTHVAAAQRALLKLGYGPLKPDGIFGPGTRQAIERFERDRRLPATGELGPRTARELSAQSGIRVE